MRRLKLGAPSGFLNLGAAGATGRGASSGLSFFLGRAMAPASAPGPPASGEAWSGCWGGGWGGFCARASDAAANATETSNSQVSEEWRRTFAFRRLVNMATSVEIRIRDQAGQVTVPAHFLPSNH